MISKTHEITWVAVSKWLFLFSTHPWLLRIFGSERLDTCSSCEYRGVLSWSFWIPRFLGTEGKAEVQIFHNELQKQKTARQLLEVQLCICVFFDIKAGRQWFVESNHFTETKYSAVVANQLGCQVLRTILLVRPKVNGLSRINWLGSKISVN